MNQPTPMELRPYQSPLPDLQLHVLLKLCPAKQLGDLLHATAVLADSTQRHRPIRLELLCRLWPSLGLSSNLQTNSSAPHTAFGLWLDLNPGHHQKLNYCPSDDHRSIHPQNPQILSNKNFLTPLSLSRAVEHKTLECKNPHTQQKYYPVAIQRFRQALWQRTNSDLQKTPAP